MAENLVIVESPAKAKTIEGFLGKDYIVKSSYGHIRDLAKSDKAIDVLNRLIKLPPRTIDDFGYKAEGKILLESLL